jgi:hypothetical protein
MRKWLVLTILITILILPAGVSAQGETKLDAIRVDLFSEYDQPSMLVIYEFVVSKDTQLPTEVLFRFPKDSNLIAVAVWNTDDWYNNDFTDPVGRENWQTIKVKVESYEPHRVEYYQPLQLDGNKRQFKFHWFGDYYVKAFTVNVLIPADSSELFTTPVLENTETSEDGAFISGSVTKNDLKTMNPFKFELEYQRTSTALIDPDPSTDQVQPVAPVNEDTPGRVSITNLPWIIGGFGLALIGIALFSYWRSTQSQSNESQPRRRHRPKAGESAEDGQAYCHECGARAHAGDRFCRTCGSRLRVE